MRRLVVFSGCAVAALVLVAVLARAAAAQTDDLDVLKVI
jgi:hypothetical protein